MFLGTQLAGFSIVMSVLCKTLIAFLAYFVLGEMDMRTTACWLCSFILSALCVRLNYSIAASCRFLSILGIVSSRARLSRCIRFRVSLLA